MWRSRAGAPSCLPMMTTAAPSAGPIVIVVELLKKFWFPPSLPSVYGGREPTALSLAPIDPAIVTLLWVNGIRTDTPTPTPVLKRLSAMPTVSTRRNPPPPHPHPRLRYRVRQRGRSPFV